MCVCVRTYVRTYTSCYTSPQSKNPIRMSSTPLVQDGAYKLDHHYGIKATLYFWPPKTWMNDWMNDWMDGWVE